MTDNSDPRPYRILITGGRDYGDWEELSRELDQIASVLLTRNEVPVIIHGCARGADTLGGRWAEQRGYEQERHPADWERYGKRAGYLRNEQMADTLPALVVAFPGGSGTRHMVRTALARNLSLYVVRNWYRET